MNLAVNGLSALKVLRTLRQTDPARSASLTRVDLPAPRSAQGTQWSRKRLAAFLEPFGCAASFSSKSPLAVAVPSAADRLRIKDVTCTVYSSGLPKGAFLDAGDGLAISSPELLFVELAAIMPFEVHLLLGFELCGTFACDPKDPRSGKVAYHVPAVTSVERIRSFMDECHGVRGIRQARETLEWLLDNAWSPMEAVVAALAVLPAEQLGYGMWPVKLNPRVESDAGAAKAERVPDLVFTGTDVGLNYDGEEHLPLQGIVDASLRLALSPNQGLGAELTEAVAKAREGSVSDKRRDRDLAAAGMTVLAMTKEDLYERGGLDRLMLQVVETIERSGKRRLAKQRAVLNSKLLCDLRQELIWSLLPGGVGIAHTVTYAKLFEENPDPERYMHISRFVNGEWHVSLIDRTTGKAVEPGQR